MKRERGKPGQFDVVVDGEVVASRSGGMLERLLRGGWPDPEEVVRKIDARRQQKQKA